MIWDKSMKYTEVLGPQNVPYTSSGIAIELVIVWRMKRFVEFATSHFISSYKIHCW